MEKSPNLMRPGFLDGLAHVLHVLDVCGVWLAGVSIQGGAVAEVVGSLVASGGGGAARSMYLSTISWTSGGIWLSISSTSVGCGRGLLDGPGAASSELRGASTER